MEWASWVQQHSASSAGLSPELHTRQLRLLFDLLTEMTGPLRRQATEHWLGASEWYGRTAADRGLATGEIVEEFQHLRGLLIRHLSLAISAMPNRPALATVLRINRFLDQGIAHAVVGYTDALVESLLNKRGMPVSTADASSEIEERLAQFEKTVASFRARS